MKPQLTMALAICLLLLTTMTYVNSSAQSKKVSFNNSTVVPGAEGTVKVKKDKNSNYNIEVNIQDLPDPAKLTPARKVYVVWVDTQEKGFKNVGQIHSASSLFSKLKKASITTVSPNKPVKVFVSAEDDSGVEQPGTVVVLTTDSF
jgi:hypothetical protein